jgi:hypothetical protein
MNSMAHLLRQPVVHFVVLGVLLGGLLSLLTDDEAAPDETTIRITTQELARMQAEWAARWRRPPTRQELDGLLDASVRERVLYREAVGMGLDRDDQMIRRVLVQKLERITNDLIELSLAPTDQDLELYYAEKAESYQPPPLITLTHVFIDRDKRGGSAASDAEALVAELGTRGEAAAAEAGRLGDRFMLEAHYSENSRQRVASLFAEAVSASAFDLAPGEWHGPAVSGYGLHAVFVHSLTEFPVPPLAEVRDAVRQDWVDEKRREITEQYYDDLLARYDVVIEGQSEGAPVGADASSGS